MVKNSTPKRATVSKNANREDQDARAEAKALKRIYERGSKFDVVVPVYDLQENKLTPSGKWIKSRT